MSEAMSERVKLLQEAAILAQFRHPNVVRLHGITNKDNVVKINKNIQLRGANRESQCSHASMWNIWS